MVRMWDQLFADADPAIESALKRGDGYNAHRLMHEHLGQTWIEVIRVLKEGGIACINIGDATRTIGGSFSLYPNHSTIIHFFQKSGLSLLPAIIWRKPSNKPNKFMGSGMLPSNAYVTHEHEYILIFRKGGTRLFSNRERIRRQRSAYFWEERNAWFSDIWTDLKGTLQSGPGIQGGNAARERSASYPFELPFRLIQMYSIQGDTILDPFLGTGTTTLAAAASGRNSVGYESDPWFSQYIRDRLRDCREYCNRYEQKRVDTHREYMDERRNAGKNSRYISERYGFDTVTFQEVKILIPLISTITENADGSFEFRYHE
jgi:DNA modification methylase